MNIFEQGGRCATSHNTPYVNLEKNRRSPTGLAGLHGGGLLGCGNVASQKQKHTKYVQGQVYVLECKVNHGCLLLNGLTINHRRIEEPY